MSSVEGDGIGIAGGTGISGGGRAPRARSRVEPVEHPSKGRCGEDDPCDPAGGRKGQGPAAPGCRGVSPDPRRARGRPVADCRKAGHGRAALGPGPCPGSGPNPVSGRDPCPVPGPNPRPRRSAPGVRASGRGPAAGRGEVRGLWGRREHGDVRHGGPSLRDVSTGCGLRQDVPGLAPHLPVSALAPTASRGAGGATACPASRPARVAAVRVRSRCGPVARRCASTPARCCTAHRSRTERRPRTVPCRGSTWACRRASRRSPGRQFRPRPPA